MCSAYVFLLNINEMPFKIEELLAALNKLRKRRGPGPDDEAMEFYQILDLNNKYRLLEIINDWWNNNEFPTDRLLSRIIFLYKKDSPADILNYRPIALTNSLYKIFTSMIQKRMTRAMDHVLNKTQYGFRKERSTPDAIFMIRRILEQGERSHEKSPSLTFVTLDWEKAFDSVINESLFVAPDRLRVHEHYIKKVKQLYSGKKFLVELNGETSEVYDQETVIRQGCPLSPYLFLCVMTVLFHDIKNNKDLQDELIKNRINETICDEILYADDTIIFSENL